MHRQTFLDRVTHSAEEIPGVDAMATRDALRLHDIHRRLDKLYEKHLEQFGLSPRRLEILEELYHHDGQAMTPAELAETVSVTRAAMTGNLDRLERLRYVRRGPHPHDRRSVLVHLTAEGAAFLKPVLEDRYRKGARIISCLTPVERTTMLEYYQRILHAITQELESAPRHDDE